jgi:hypothetical protein
MPRRLDAKLWATMTTKMRQSVHRLRKRQEEEMAAVINWVNNAVVEEKEPKEDERLRPALLGNSSRTGGRKGREKQGIRKRSMASRLGKVVSPDGPTHAKERREYSRDGTGPASQRKRGETSVRPQREREDRISQRSLFTLSRLNREKREYDTERRTSNGRGEDCPRRKDDREDRGREARQRQAGETEKRSERGQSSKEEERRTETSCHRESAKRKERRKERVDPGKRRRCHER